MPDKKTSSSKSAPKTAAKPAADKAKSSPRRERAETPAKTNARTQPVKSAPAKATTAKTAKPTGAKAPVGKAATPAKAPPKVKAPAPKVAAPKTSAPKAAAKPEAKPQVKAKASPSTAKAAPQALKSSPAPKTTKTSEKPAAKPEPKKAPAKQAVNSAAEHPAPAAKRPETPAPSTKSSMADAKSIEAPNLEGAKPVEAPRAVLATPKPASILVAAGSKPINAPPPPPKPVAKPVAVPTPAPAPEPIAELKPVPVFKGATPTSGVKNPVLVGAISGAFGVKGEVRIRSFTASPDGVIAYGPLYDADGKILLRPKTWRESKDGVVITAPEVKSKEEADELRGQRLYIPRAHLPETKDEDEFYIVDLLGCSAEAVDGAVLGEVVAVWNFGAGDIIEFKPSQGQNVRISFTKETVPLVDLAHRRVVIDPPAPEPAA